MNLAAVEKIVNAVLYEGYVLYPYRASTIKNRQRWTFGGLFPKAFAEVHQSDPYQMQTECLLRGNDATVIQVHTRFLHLVTREAGKLGEPLTQLQPDHEILWTPVEVLEVNDRQYYSWQEATEREVTVHIPALGALARNPVEKSFRFASFRTIEPLQDEKGLIAGVLVRSHETIEGKVSISAESIASGLWRLRVQIANETGIQHPDNMPRPEAQPYAFASTHCVLTIQDGEFISLFDPPSSLAQEMAACKNAGLWPVLVGEHGQRDLMLAAPIILYDYPQIAPESLGDLFDSTEIDEILSLRILTMTDDEKREMAAVDERARALLQRTESMQPEQWQTLHGTLREIQSLEPAYFQPRASTVRIGNVELCIGDHVRLHPREGGDIMDLALAGKTAVIESIEQDFEDRLHVAVTIDDDPGRNLGLERMPGHRFFFSPEEIEPIHTTEAN